jgi:hypothetical protein
MTKADEKFEYWMQQELEYAKLEYDAVRYREYDSANRFHELRWKCMDLAVSCIEGGAS